MQGRVVAGLALAALLAVAGLDVAFSWAAIVTPLYILPVLTAALYLAPRPVCGIAAGATALTLVSGLLQQAPPVITLVTTASVWITSYLAVLFSEQRERSSFHARAAERHAGEAEAARQQLQDFLGMVSHDLRSPLTSLLGYTQLLETQLDQPSPDILRRAIPAMENAVRRITRLADDLLDAARIGAGRFTVRPAATDLAEIARQVTAQHQATVREHRIVLDAPERLDGMWDRERMGQVLGNLISNALKYSPADREIKVTVREGEDAVSICVADQGLGIPAEELPSLFQPFSRLPSGRLHDGTGLGLHITQAIVEAHGGRIWVESAEGEGSSFHITLPRNALQPAFAGKP